MRRLTLFILTLIIFTKGYSLHCMPPLPGPDDPPPTPSYVQVSYSYQGDKISGIATVNSPSLSMGDFVANAVIEGACLDMNNQWNVSISTGWNGWDGWYVNWPKGDFPQMSSFGTQKSFYFTNMGMNDPSPKTPYFAYFTYSFGYNTNTDFATYWSASGWDYVYGQWKNLGGVANTWHRSGTSHDTYRIGPVLVWGFPNMRGMAGTVANYSKKDWWLGWNGDSCLWGVELYKAVPNGTNFIQVPFSTAAAKVGNNTWVDIPLNISTPIDTSTPVRIDSASITPFQQSFIKNCAYINEPNFNLTEFVDTQSALLSIFDSNYTLRAQQAAAGILPPAGIIESSIIYLNNKPFIRARVQK